MMFTFVGVTGDVIQPVFIHHQHRITLASGAGKMIEGLLLGNSQGFFDYAHAPAP
jgi:hypothetical protein